MTLIWSGGIDNASVFPTENDVHGSSAALTGSVATETVFPPLMAYCGGQMNRVISGFNLPANGTTNTAVHIDPGTCVIDGYLVRCDTTQSIQVASDVANNVWVRLIYVDGKVSYPAIDVRQTATVLNPPANSVYLGTISCGATTVTETKDCRCQGRMVAGRIGMQTTGGLTGDGCWTCRDIGTSNWVLSSYRPGGAADSFTVTFDQAFLRPPMVFLQSYSGPFGGTPYCVGTIDADVSGLEGEHVTIGRHVAYFTISTTELHVHDCDTVVDHVVFMCIG
jgi:hypothetical protein